MLKKYQKSVEEVGIRYKRCRGKYVLGCREGTNFWQGEDKNFKMINFANSWDFMNNHSRESGPSRFTSTSWILWTFMVFSSLNADLEALNLNLFCLHRTKRLEQRFWRSANWLYRFVRAALIRWYADSASISPPQRHDLMWTRSLSFR